ncbi:hypothetical protein BCR34DRAFT_555821 [Clohesyomyces aquaticus]|uniref:Uncharacterized protein n=1 Tax=Clohesyomyces aquaticus TaxID=1231657 RepID=A0A1Y2A492_9PLEO|nr:hypothetical protein BCR34DRAFT_555821 [Clohesyomyces aquaticus]
MVADTETETTDEETQARLAAQVHRRGQIDETLQPRFQLARVSPLAGFEEKKEVRLSYNYNATKILVSLGQTLFSVFTLYRSRGDQIKRYGSAAFGLTVLPYALMSTINLFANLMMPTYPRLYLVESSALRFARGRGGSFRGTVGTIEETEQEKEDMELNHSQIAPADTEGVTDASMAIIIVTIPLAINAAMSSFHSGSSTKLQYRWILVWLGESVIVGLFAGTFWVWVLLLILSVMSLSF